MACLILGPLVLGLAISLSPLFITCIACSSSKKDSPWKSIYSLLYLVWYFLFAAAYVSGKPSLWAMAMVAVAPLCIIICHVFWGLMSFCGGPCCYNNKKMSAFFEFD